MSDTFPTIGHALDDVRPFLDEGFAIHLLKKRSKAPLHNGWSDRPRATKDELEGDYRKGMNVGVRLGKPSVVEDMYLHVIDLDIRDDEYADEAHEALREMFPDVNFDRLPTVQSGSRGESRHYYFLTQDPFRSKKLAHSKDKFEDENGHTHWCWEIELFGTGKQVAMPPSIHPDTGKRYRWLVEVDWLIGIPMIDAEVLSDLVHVEEDREPVEHEPLDMTLDEAREELREIQDWADDRETWMRVGMGLKYDFGEDGWDVFDEWSEHGKSYDRRENRKQWRSYKNDHKNPVTFRTALAEVHRRIHQQQLREAVNMLDDLEDDDDLIGDGEPEDVEVGENRLSYDEVVSQIDVPEHLLSIPGKLQLAVDYYNKISMTTQPQFAVQAAIALGSVVTGRNHMTELDNPPMLYLLNVGGTGAGKETIKKTVRKVLKAAKLSKPLIGPRYYTSDAAVFWELTAMPRHFTFLDEFGKRMGDDKGDHMKQGVFSAYLEVYGSYDDDYQPGGYSHKGRTKEESIGRGTAPCRDLRSPFVGHQPPTPSMTPSVPRTWRTACSIASSSSKARLPIRSRRPLSRQWRSPRS